jgi:hypothetical protein
MEPSHRPVDRHVVFEDQGSAFDQLRGKARRGEPGQVRPFREWVAGDELHRNSGKRRRVERVIDRENDWYSERIFNEAGDLVWEVEERLSEHRGRGAAKPPTDPGA